MLPSPSSSHHRKITHLLSVWNSSHLDFVFTTVIRVVRRGFCCSLDGHGEFGPEKATLCSDIIQNPGERVTILTPTEGVMPPSSSFQHRKTTYFSSAWNSEHLEPILATVVGVVRKGFCCSPDRFGPEKDTLCSEAPDEDALIHSWARIYLSA
jgi:hypothetical protein